MLLEVIYIMMSGPKLDRICIAKVEQAGTAQEPGPKKVAQKSAQQETTLALGQELFEKPLRGDIV